MDAKIWGEAQPETERNTEKIYIQIGRCGFAVVVVTLKNTARNVYVTCEYVRLDVRAQHMCICVPLIKESEIMTHACHTLGMVAPPLMASSLRGLYRSRGEVVYYVECKNNRFYLHRILKDTRCKQKKV